MTARATNNWGTRIHAICRIALMIFAAAYAVALVLFIAGKFSLFTSGPLPNPSGPPSVSFLQLLGRPWTLALALRAIPASFRPWLTAGAPLLNMVMLWMIGRITIYRAY